MLTNIRSVVLYPSELYSNAVSGGSLDGCHYRTDATCKTVANKGISFFNVVLGPYTPPHGSHNPPTTYSKNL